MAPNTRALLISSIDEPNWPSQLKNTNIAYANPQSLVAMIGNKWLLSKGLTAETDYKQVVVPREDNIGGMILAGDAKFGILSNAELRSIPERIQSKLKVLEVLAEIPNFVVLTNANFSTLQNEQIKALLLKFADKNEQGEAFFKLSGFTSIRSVSDLQMKVLDTYLAQTRAALGQ
jgi:ABC-type phosphate/phosphonate transport system substrate-binding protein